MESTILHVAIDCFAVQAERLRCPKLVGRPVALAAEDSPRPRVLAVSREARAAGVTPGTPLVLARRLCRDLVPLPPDRDLYTGLADSIRARLAPYAPFGDSTGLSAGRFVLDLTGVARTHDGTRDRAARAGREVERAFGLHPTLGLASTRLVSGIAARVLAPDGELLDIRPGGEEAFLAPLAARVLPSSRVPATSSRLDLLALRVVRDLQALTMPQLHAAFGPSATLLWREARGLDTVPLRAVEPPPSAVAEETLATESNDRRSLALRVSRLAIEIGAGLQARRAAARRLAVKIVYADGREGGARVTLPQATTGEQALRDEAVALLDRAMARRVRVRRLRLEAWEEVPRAVQIPMWVAEGEEPGRGPAPAPGAGREAPSACSPPATHRDRSNALAAALRAIRQKLGTETLIPASWLAHGLVTPSPRRDRPRRP